MLVEDFVMRVDHGLLQRAQLAIGAEVCDVLGYDGFLLTESVLLFLRAPPDALRASAVPDPKCTLVTYRRTLREEGFYRVVPMGHYCLTAAFLRTAGWRFTAFPLDWSRHTLKVWQHMLADDFQTVLCRQRAGEEEHPYNRSFQDVHMFLHQGGWANEDVLRRVRRLQCCLAEGRAFGLAIYFEGGDNVRAPFEEVVADARQLAQGGHGFVHIALIWFVRLEGGCGDAFVCAAREPDPAPPDEWLEVDQRLSVLRYFPSETTNYWDGALRPADTLRLARLLEARFPSVFFRGPSALHTHRQSPPSVGSNESGGSWSESIKEFMAAPP